MHFDQRTQRAFRDVGLETDELRAASEAVVDAVAEDAAALEAFFDEHDTVYPTWRWPTRVRTTPNTTSTTPTSRLTPTRCAAGSDSTWGVSVEDGRILGDGHVELSLGPTIDDRVRFAADRDTPDDVCLRGGVRIARARVATRAATRDRRATAAVDGGAASARGGSAMTTARVRGIYTTAITRLLSETGREVVQASEPIRERFERSFDAAPADVSIETTRDRQGVEISGTPDAVEPVANELEDLAIDTFRWPDDVSRGAVFDADVLEAGGGSGAVVDPATVGAAF